MTQNIQVTGIQISPSNIRLGNKLTLTVVANNDGSLYTGTVVGMCDYECARAYSNVAAIQMNMQQAVDHELTPATEQSYVLLKCEDDKVRAFALEWIDSVWLTSEGKTFVIELYNTTLDGATAAIYSLRDIGYTCKLKTT